MKCIVPSNAKLCKEVQIHALPYRLYITAQKYSFLPCGVTARTKNIYLFWGCGIEKRGFLAYFGACRQKSLCGVGVN
jgi:hypothetical protein